MRRINYIVIHHTGSKWGCAEEIIHWHTDPKPKGNGWSKPGYHYMINNGYPNYRSFYRRQKAKGWDGKIENCDHGLVPPEQTSNGVLGFNSKAINICLTGNFDEAQPTEAQLNALEVLCLTLIKKYNIELKNVMGHREAIALREKIQGKRKKDHKKSCPGSQFNPAAFRKRLAMANRETEYFYFDK